MPRNMIVRELMSTDVVTLTEDETLAHAKMCMERGHIRHLPVLRERKLVGLVTHRDLLAASFSSLSEVGSTEQRRVFATLPVVEVMNRDFMTVQPDLQVAGAARMLLDSKVGCLPVVDDDGTLVGIITETDFLRLTVRLLL